MIYVRGRLSVLVVALLVAAALPIACGGSKKAGQADGGSPAGCRNSLDCSLGMVCDPSIAQCVECVSAVDCPANNDCTARKCVPFVPCKNSLDCGTTAVCDTTTGRCVACLTDADCADTTKTCQANSCRTKCASDRTCTPLGLLCDLTTGSCVRCNSSTDCPTGQYCQANACIAAICTHGKTSCMLSSIATCNAVGDGYTGTAVPCDPQICVSGASGAMCADAAPDGGAGTGGTTGTGGATGAGGTTGTGGATGAGGTTGTGGATGAGGTTGTGGATGAGGTAGAGGGGAGSGGAGRGGTTGGGGTVGGAGAGGSAGGSCGLLIDNMEADTGVICQGNGRIGHWFTYNSGGRDVQTPPPGVVPTLPDMIPPPRGSSSYAMHTYGTFSIDGAIGCSLNGSTSDLVEVPRAYSVSAYTGLSFYAKGTPAALQVIVATTDDVAPTYGGTCASGACISNHANITLSSTTWTLYQVPFSQLASGTYLFNPARVLTIDFQAQNPTSGTLSADFWIDDLSFY